MNPTLRRALLISAFVVVTLGWLFLIYWFFFRPVRPIPLANNGNRVINGLVVPGNRNANRAVNAQNVNGLFPITNVPGASSVANGGPTKVTTVTSDATSGLTVPGDQSGVFYYDQRTGQFFKLSPDGSSRSLLTDDIYHNVQTVAWAPDGTKAVLTFPDGSKILYDFATKKQTTLPKELNNFSFSPQSDKIVSKYLDPNNTTNQWLVVSQPDGSQSISVEQLGENADKVIPNWSPNQQIIATYEKSVNTDQTSIFFLGANSENFPSVDVNGRGFDPLWSPDGRRLLYSTYSSVTDNNPNLFLMSASPDTLGAAQLDLGIQTTADKCTFTGNGLSLYCAVPYYLNPGSGPDPSQSAGVPDNFYRVDLVSNSSTLIARPVDNQGTQRFSAINLVLSPNGDALYFTDALTGTLQRIALR